VVDIEKFELFKKYAEFQNFFVKLLSVTIVFLVIQALLFLNTQFPIFGIIFHALGKAKNVLIAYGLVIPTSFVFTKIR
jgi:hypothetical protein